MILSETAAFIYEHLEEAIKVRDKKANTVNEQDIRLGMKGIKTTGWICDSMHYFHAGNSSLQYCRSDFSLVRV